MAIAIIQIRYVPSGFFTVNLSFFILRFLILSVIRSGSTPQTLRPGALLPTLSAPRGTLRHNRRFSLPRAQEETFLLPGRRGPTDPNPRRRCKSMYQPRRSPALFYLMLSFLRPFIPDRLHRGFHTLADDLFCFLFPELLGRILLPPDCNSGNTHNFIHKASPLLYGMHRPSAMLFPLCSFDLTCHHQTQGSHPLHDGHCWPFRLSLLTFPSVPPMLCITGHCYARVRKKGGSHS